MEDQPRFNFLSKIGLAIFGFLLILVVLAISHYGILEVNVENASGSLNYSLANQAGQKASSLQAGSHFRKIVSKGSYEVSANQMSNSSFAVVKTSGFLRKTAVKLKLSPEKSRQFIGNNPQPCTFFDGNVLYSYACGAELSKIVKHQPATSSLPTYTSKLPDTLNATVLGIAKTNAGSVVLLKEQSISVSFSVATLEGGFSVKNQKELPGLDRTSTYNILPYRDGFVIYDSAFGKILYYSSVGASPQSISIPKPDDNTQNPSFLTTAGDKILAVYSDNSQGQDTGIETSVAKIKNTLVIYSQNQSKKFVFDKQLYTSASLCGQDKLCLVSNKQLSVYDINSPSPKFLYKVGNVNSIFSSRVGLVLARDNEILALDVDHQTGNREYSFGDYQLCGLQNGVGGYTLCLINNKNDKVALIIDESTDDSGNIDKKVAELQKAPEIENISIYKNYIYISPNLGQLKYDSTIKGYTYDPGTKKRVNAAIDQKIQELKIDTNTYRVINISK